MERVTDQLSTRVTQSDMTDEEVISPVIPPKRLLSP